MVCLPPPHCASLPPSLGSVGVEWGGLGGCGTFSRGGEAAPGGSLGWCGCLAGLLAALAARSWVDAVSLPRAHTSGMHTARSAHP